MMMMQMTSSARGHVMLSLVVFFLLSGEMVEVVSVDGDSIFVLGDDSVDQQQISLREAAELLRAYIG